MPKPLQELLGASDDLELSNGVDDLLRVRFRDDLDAMPAEGQVVLWSLQAYGIIGNGGFQYLFEWWSSPESYALALAGFQAIGADECAAALAEVLELFPGGVPPADRDGRLRGWHGCLGANSIDRRFWKGSEKLAGLLAAYIRSHRKAFERTLASPDFAPPLLGRTEAEPGAAPGPAA